MNLKLYGLLAKEFAEVRRQLANIGLKTEKSGDQISLAIGALVSEMSHIEGNASGSRFSFYPSGLFSHASRAYISQSLLFARPGLDETHIETAGSTKFVVRFTWYQDHLVIVPWLNDVKGREISVYLFERDFGGES